jgi:hypothetical protein
MLGALIKRFKDSPTRLQGRSEEDERNGRDVRSYVSSVMRHAKAAEFNGTLQQLSQSYNNLDPDQDWR